MYITWPKHKQKYLLNCKICIGQRLGWAEVKKIIKKIAYGKNYFSSLLSPEWFQRYVFSSSSGLVNYLVYQ